MSAWTELACLFASIFLVSSIGVCLKCFPLLVCQCLSSGVTWFLSEFFLKGLSLLISVSEQSCLKGLRSFCQSVSLVCLDGSPCFCLSWYPIFFTLLRMPTGCLPLGLPRFCFKNYQISFWSSRTKFFIKTVQVWQLASKDTDRSWCRFQGFHRQAQSYLDYSTWNNVFRI